MAMVGQTCEKCRIGTVKLNEHNVPQCQNKDCLKMHPQPLRGVAPLDGSGVPPRIVEP